jgi:hypothetical protein
LPERDAERLEMPQYFECEMALDQGPGIATVLTTRVPRTWHNMKTLDEPATVIALYLKALSKGGEPSAVWLAKEIAWHPTRAAEPHVSFGKSVLGTLAMDVGLLDAVRGRGQILAAEREAFYEMLDVAGRIGAHQLARFAQSNVAAVRDVAKRDLDVEQDEARRALAQEVVRRAEEGRHSVAPLFNEPDRHIGDLVVFDGVARRAVRVDADPRLDDARRNDVARRFGIENYYEMEVFTDDSQDYPLIFCMHDLPENFPTGSNLHVPVRVAGFFFKDWQYTTRKTAGTSSRAPQVQYSPLLIGRHPLILQQEQGLEVAQWVGGGLFLLALAGVWFSTWWLSRSDRKFTERRRISNFSLPTGQSLNELNLPVVDQPMIYSGVAESETANSA